MNCEGVLTLYQFFSPHFFFVCAVIIIQNQLPEIALSSDPLCCRVDGGVALSKGDTGQGGESGRENPCVTSLMGRFLNSLLRMTICQSQIATNTAITR